MFRRSKPEPPAPEPKPGGKGRPTPTRKEAEAAAKARAKAPTSRRERAAMSRAERGANSAQVRAALNGTGDDRFLPARDRGPVRSFLRDLVDQRLTISEFVLPMMLITLIMGYSGVPALRNASNGILLGTVLVVTYDIIMLRMRVRRGLADRFPGESTRGHVWYAVSRLLQLRWFRMPKPRLKVGQPLAEHYR